MAADGNAHGMIGVDKMGAKILFIDPTTYGTQKVLDGFQRTVHELLIVPETGLAYVPIYGDGIMGATQILATPSASSTSPSARMLAISTCSPTSRRIPSNSARTG